MSKAKRYTPRTRNLSLKGLLLYLLPAPLLISAFFSFFKGDVSSIIHNSVAFALFLLAATLAKRGFDQEKHYHDSKLIKAPKLPFKTSSAIFLAIATFYTATFCTDNAFFLNLLLAGASFLGFYLYYGFDPREDKIGDLPAGVNADDFIEITQEARQGVENLQSFKQQLNNFESKEHLQSIIMETKEIITDIEHNPSDLSRARKFFKIYLKRTEDITQDFVNNLKNGNIDETLVDNYNTLLISVKETIKEQKEKLNDDDILRLDVQIEALTKQLNHEGV